MSVLYTNIRSLYSKKESLSASINESEADVIALTETWLSRKIASNELFQCNKKYGVYRRDRGCKIGGGVLWLLVTIWSHL